MFNVFKRLSFVIVVLLLFVFNNNVSAKSSCYFVWEKTTIEVPYKASVYDYKDDYIVKFYVEGIESDEFDVYREVNGSTLSTVVTSRLGKYIVYYKAFSIEYNISSTVAITFLVVDVNPPQLSLLFDAVKVEYGSRLSEVAFYRVTDDIYNPSELQIDIDDSMVNYNVLGVYPAKITATDGYGNNTFLNFYTEVIDTTPPTIKVLQPLVFHSGQAVNLEEYFKEI